MKERETAAVRLCEACGTARADGEHARFCRACRERGQRERVKAQDLPRRGREAYRRQLTERAARGHETAGLGTAGE